MNNTEDKFIELYHGTGVKFNSFDASKCNTRSDFGKGLYLTPDINMAIRMAYRKYGRTNKAYLYTYLLPKAIFEHCILTVDKKIIKAKIFTGADVEWGELVLRNRTNKYYSDTFDIIAGPIADGDVSSISYRFMKKIESCRNEEKVSYLNEFIRLVNAHVFSTQVCLHTEEAIKLAKLIEIKRLK